MCERKDIKEGEMEGGEGREGEREGLPSRHPRLPTPSPSRRKRWWRSCTKKQPGGGA